LHFLGIRLLQNFSGNFVFRPEKSGHTNFRPEFFWNFQISNQKKSGRKTFRPKFFRISNFRPENFLVFQISRPKRVRVLRSRPMVRIAGFTTVVPVSCRTDNLFSNFRAGFFFFFQISIQKFLGFSNFALKKVGRTNFRGQKIRAYQLSNQKFLAVKKFRPYGQEQIGRIRSCGLGSLRRETCNKSRFSPHSRRSFQKFLARKFKIFFATIDTRHSGEAGTWKDHRGLKGNDYRC
jgi:hypothetical protein